MQKKLCKEATLSIDFLEIKMAGKAAVLFKLLQPVKEEFPELNDRLIYIQALFELDKGNESRYAQQMRYLLSRLDDSWSETFRYRVKQQASHYFSEKLQYKKAYTILVEK